jgi:hypothetical protein
MDTQFYKESFRELKSHVRCLDMEHAVSYLMWLSKAKMDEPTYRPLMYCSLTIFIFYLKKCSLMHVICNNKRHL